MSVRPGHEVACPHCGADTLFFVDPTEGVQHELIEDCQVCCRAILFRVVLGGESMQDVEIHVEPAD